MKAISRTNGNASPGLPRQTYRGGVCGASMLLERSGGLVVSDRSRKPSANRKTTPSTIGSAFQFASCRRIRSRSSSEGKLQLVMRNSVDQADEQTSGANKRTLLSGERAMLTPEPGISSNSTPKAAPTSPRRIAPPRPVVKEVASAPKTTQAAAPPRPTVEVIKGAKKEIQDFPQ